MSPHTYILLIQEDSVIEYAQAIFYFLASIFPLFISIRFFKNKLTLHGVLYGILAIGLLFISLEEISWGQRIFHLETFGYIARHNTQHEISLHNLDTVQPLLHAIYILTGGYGAFAWLFALLFVSRAKTKCSHIANFIVPDWFISSYFFFAFFLYILLSYIGLFGVSIGIEELRIGRFLRWRDQEPAELLLSLGFLSFVLVNYTKSRICLTMRRGEKQEGSELSRNRSQKSVAKHRAKRKRPSN